MLSPHELAAVFLLLKERREAAAKASAGSRAQLLRLLRLPSLSKSPPLASLGDRSRLPKGGRGEEDAG